MNKEIISTKKAPAAIGPYSQAVVLDKLIFISGQLPIDPTSNTVNSGIKEQTIQVLENLKAILESKNIGMANLIKTTIFLKDFNDFALVNEIYASYFTLNYPARSTVEVSRLPKDVLIEIEAIAYF